MCGRSQAVSGIVKERTEKKAVREYHRPRAQKDGWHEVRNLPEAAKRGTGDLHAENLSS